MHYLCPTILNFYLLDNHPFVLALADIGIGGFIIFGVKLECDDKGRRYLGFPGRRVKNAWQEVCRIDHDPSKQHLLELLSQCYDTVVRVAA